MRFRAVFLCATSLLLAGCATNKSLIATGGSRADGTVNLSYEYGAFERPKIDLVQGEMTARERCKAWGYSDAQPFGGQTQQCQLANQYGCVRWFVTMTFQCLGANKT